MVHPVLGLVIVWKCFVADLWFSRSMKFLKMESQQNNIFLKDGTENFSIENIEFDNITTSGSYMLPNVSEITINGNQTAIGQELYEVHTVVVIVLSLFYGAICITAILGNLLVLRLVLASKTMQTVTNIFIANLALADICIAMFAIPFQFQAALLQKWNLPNFLCAICPFVQVLSVTVSVLTLVVIALDRYRAVMHPFKAKSSKKMAYGAILAIWVVSFLLALPTEMDFSVIKVTTNGMTKDFCTNVHLPETFRLYYNQGIVIIQYFFPLFIITKAYFRIGRTLWTSNTPGNQEEARDALVLRNQKKIIKMLLTVVFMFAFCWFPLQTYNFLQAVFPSINSFEYINILWFCFHWLAMSNSCCNPFIYAVFNKKFKAELFKRIPCLAKVWPENRSRNNTILTQMNNRNIGESIRAQHGSCSIKVIYNPVKLNLAKVNMENISEDDSSNCKFESDVHASVM